MNNNEAAILDSLDNVLKQDDLNDDGVAALLKRLKKDNSEEYEAMIAETEARLGNCGADVRTLIPEYLPDENNDHDEKLNDFAKALFDNYYI